MVAPAAADVPPPTMLVKIASAGISACLADIITFPLDTAKVRLQVGAGIQGRPAAPCNLSRRVGWECSGGSMNEPGGVPKLERFRRRSKEPWYFRVPLNVHKVLTDGVCHNTPTSLPGIRVGAPPVFWSSEPW